jgi:hypothetical protein
MRYPPLVWNNPAFISWDVYDAKGNPVIGATVTVTLYINRSPDTPDTIPGQPVSPAWTNLMMTDQLDGNYTVEVAAANIPAIGINYILVFDAVVSGAEVGHWEAQTSVVVATPRTPSLAELENVKEYLGISLTDTSQDATLSRWIQSVSADFLNRIKRPGLLPPMDYTDYILMTNWKVEDREKDLFLKNWPVNRIASVTINEVVVPPYDFTDPTTLGWFFDPTLPDEERQYITLKGLVWPVFQSWFTPRRPIYRPAPMRIQIAYNGGYSSVPFDIEEAVIEWVAYKKGLSQLQSADQTEQWIQLGQYQQKNMIAESTLKLSGMDLPASVEAVIQVYERPVVP